MTTAQHTPGPWKAVTNKFGTTVVEGGGEVLVVMETNKTELDQANAALIAAAPSMKTMLEAVLYKLSDGMDGQRVSGLETNDELCREISKLLAKAEGENEGGFYASH